MLGILSLMFWALTLVVSIKYAAFILRADNKGEGGIMALIALTRRATSTNAQVRWLLASLGLFGAAVFYGDSMLTPAISVLSAVEGPKIAAPSTRIWAKTSFFFSHETLIATRLPGMARWRGKLFIDMARNASSTMGFFKIPPIA